MTDQKQKIVLDSKTVFWSIGFLTAFFIPVTYVHELGHAIVCSSEGLEYKIAVGINGGFTLCKGDLKNDFIYWMMGGTLATVVSLIPLAFRKLTLKNPSVLIASLSFATGNGFIAIVETVAHQSYINDSVMWYGVSAVVNVVTFIVLVLKYAQKPPALPLSHHKYGRWNDLKEKLLVGTIMTAVFLPARLLFYTYISPHWLGSFGLVSAIAVLMYVLVKKKKIGWFGTLFEKQMYKITRGKAGKLVFASAIFFLVYFGSTIVLIDRGNTVYLEEKQMVYQEYLEKQNELAGKTLQENLQQTLDLSKQTEVWAGAILDFDHVFSILYAIANDMTGGWILHFHTVIFVEQMEIVAMLFFYRYAYHQQAKVSDK